MSSVSDRRFVIAANTDLGPRFWHRCCLAHRGSSLTLRMFPPLPASSRPPPLTVVEYELPVRISVIRAVSVDNSDSANESLQSCRSHQRVYKRLSPLPFRALTITYHFFKTSPTISSILSAIVDCMQFVELMVERHFDTLCNVSTAFFQPPCRFCIFLFEHIRPIFFAL